MGSLLQRSGGEREQVTGALACSLPKGGQTCSFYGVRVEVCPGVGLEGRRLRWAAHPLGGVVCRGHAQCPAFAAGSSEVTVGFLVFVSFVQIGLNCACVQLFLVPYSFFVFCCSRRGVSRGKPCSKGSRVPARLRRTWRPREPQGAWPCRAAHRSSICAAQPGPERPPFLPEKGRRHPDRRLLSSARKEVMLTSAL